MNRCLFIVEVMIFLPITKCFTYLCPEDITPIIGCRVIVPFGNKKIIGVIIDFHHIDNVMKSNLKIIYTIIDNDFRIICDLLSLFNKLYFISYFTYVFKKRKIVFSYNVISMVNNKKG